MIATTSDQDHYPLFENVTASKLLSPFRCQANGPAYPSKGIAIRFFFNPRNCNTYGARTVVGKAVCARGSRERVVKKAARSSENDRLERTFQKGLSLLINEGIIGKN